MDLPHVHKPTLSHAQSWIGLSLTFTGSSLFALLGLDTSVHFGSRKRIFIPLQLT